MTRLLILLLGWLALPLHAQEEESISISDELEFPVKRYAAFADEAPILLWLPSSRGTSPKQAVTAGALGDLDIETWVVDLHSGYFVDAGRNSVRAFKPRDIARLIDIAASRTGEKIYLMATDSVAKPALEAAAVHQREAAAANRAADLGGVILFHPSLHYPTQQAGERARYLPIASNSTIPVYYIQPAISTKQWRSGEIQAVLQSGGSQVFFHPLPGVVAGYHMRPDDDLSEADIQARERLPEDIKRALNLLSRQVPVVAPKQFVDQEKPVENRLRYGLKPLDNRPAPDLNLQDLQANRVLVDYTGQALSLISFWASWCEPCIKELPSLKRLHNDYGHRGLRVVTVNVAESVAEIEATMAQFGMSEFLNLRDPEGEATQQWNVYGYPTNFLVTASGQLSYGSIGGIEWDEPEVRSTLDSLLDR